MPASIVLTGLATNDPTPGDYLEIQFAQGIAAGSSGPRNALFIGNKSTAGTATTNTVIYGPDTPTPAQTEQDWINLTGAGSPLHRMFRRWSQVMKNGPVGLYFVCVPSSGGAAATGTVTLTTTATGAGTLRIWVGDEYVDTGVASGDTPTVTATSAVTNINSRTHWAVTASNAAGVITLTAKVPGLRGNFIRYMAAVIGTTGGTVTPTTDTALTGGTTADSNATALGTILATKYYYIISEAEDATQYGALVTQVGTQALPTTGIRQTTFAGSVDTIANVNTAATTQNAVRAEIVWSKNSVWTPAELAANNAAVYALLENSGNKPRNNFSLFPSQANDQPLWRVPAPRDQTAWPTRADVKSALMNGVTPIGVYPNGTTYLVKRVTTRSLNGASPDYRIRDPHKRTICDFFGDDLVAKTQLQFGGKDLMDDPKPGSPPPDKQVVTPGAYKGAILKLISDYGDSGLFQNVDAIKAGTIVQRETNPTTRMSAYIPAQPVDIADQYAVLVAQVA